MNIYMTDKAIREQEELFRLEAEAIELLKYIVSEFNTDPKSVQCFDLRKVEEAKIVVTKINKLKVF